MNHFSGLLANSRPLQDFARSTHAQIIEDICLTPDSVPRDITGLHRVICFMRDVMGAEEYGLLLPAESRTDLMSSIARFAALHPQTHFIFLPTTFLDTAVEGQNFKIRSCIDHCWIQNMTGNGTITATINKDFDSVDYHWVFLNHNLRYHRILCGAYLLGKNIESHGYMTLDPGLFLPYQSWHQFIAYTSYNDRNDIFDHFQSASSVFAAGFTKIINAEGYNQKNITDPNDDITNLKVNHGLPTNSILNFNRYLAALYRHTCVEIIGETTFFTSPGMLTEKYLHTIFGCNFPIVLNVPRTIDYLRRQGFDVFDDVIDHSYDQEENHAKRLMQAIDDNQHILSNKKLAVEHWQRCQDRFQKNIEHAIALDMNTQQRFDKHMQIVLEWPNEV